MSTLTASIQPTRHIALEGSPNFRDYGGYQRADGRRVKWRKLFRSGHLSKLTATDLELFAKLDIRSVFDFRRLEECQREPNRLPEQATTRTINLPIDPGSSSNFFDTIDEGNFKPEQMAEFMCLINREFAQQQAGQFKVMFAHLLKLPEGGSLIHCAAGKDRTGFAAAMVLAALGIDRTTIFEDYMLTQRYYLAEAQIGQLMAKHQWQHPPELVIPMLEVRECYLHAAFAVIDKHYPSIEDYLQEVLAVGPSEREFLQAHYLE